MTTSAFGFLMVPHRTSCNNNARHSILTRTLTTTTTTKSRISTGNKMVINSQNYYFPAHKTTKNYYYNGGHHHHYRQQHHLLFSSLSSEDAETTRQSKYNELMDATTLSLAPMMEYTDRHFRHLVRLISSKTLLYTEMVVSSAIAHERRDSLDKYRSLHPHASDEEVIAKYSQEYLKRFLMQGKVPPLEGASVLQLGGSDPQKMFEAGQTVLEVAERGWCDYTAINLNCGCPSPKVAGKGCFGAALMEEPELVSELTKTLHEGCAGRYPITVKCRIGTDSDQPFTKATYNDIDPQLEYSRLCKFIETVASNGIVTDFSVHARIAVLSKSFSPADNRKIPPLKYEYVRKLVEDYPEFTFSLNGGISSLSEAKQELENCPGLKGIMIGRSLAADPWSFAMADKILYDTPVVQKNRWQILQEYGKHADEEERMGDPTKIRRFIVKAVMPLFAGEPNAKQYRIALDEIAGLPKKLAAEGKSSEDQPPISELIMNAAWQNLSEDVLMRTPEESFERAVSQGRINGSTFSGHSQRSKAVDEWHAQRRLETERNSAFGTAQ